MLAVLASFAAMFWLAPRMSDAPRRAGAHSGCVARSNYAIFGVPLVQLMYPDADRSVAALMVVAVVPLFNIASTIALMANSGRSEVRAKLPWCAGCSPTR